MSVMRWVSMTAIKATTIATYPNVSHKEDGAIFANNKKKHQHVYLRITKNMNDCLKIENI